MNEFKKAIKTLEFDRILSQLSECCDLESGRNKILSLTPSSDRREVARQLSLTSEAKTLLATGRKPMLYTHVSVPDILERAGKGAILTGQELLRIASLLASAASVKALGEQTSGEGVLGPVLSRLIPDKAFEAEIRRIVLSEDQIADDASPELYSIRKKINSSNLKIRENLQKYISGSMGAFLQENIITTRNGRYVIPVKVEYRNAVKGMVHDTSASGSTVFIEPASVVELNNQIRILESEQAREIEKILRTLSAEVDSRSEALALDDYNVTELSVIFAKAEYAFRLDASSPILDEGFRLRFEKARHPLVAKDRVVPINVSLGFDFDALVITGPNTGGKTVTLKTVGLLSMMVQTGMQIPVAEGSVACVFRDVLADIGDEQSIEQSLSTFSSHMVTIIDMIQRCGEGTLCLFDELGAGTDPVEGAALAVSILEHVRSRGSKLMATTHYAELKTYALEAEHVENASCEFDVNTLRPTYRLIIGTPGRSNAFLIAKRLGLPEDIIENASGRISSDSLKFEQLVEKLETDRIEMERLREEARRDREETEKMKNEALSERERLLAFAEKESERAKKEAARLVLTAKRESDEVFRELEKLKNAKEKELLAADLEKQRDQVRNRLRGIETQSEDLSVRDESDSDYVLPRPLVAGDRVIIAATGREGVVEKISGDTANVLVGSIRTRIPVKKLRLVTGLSPQKKTSQGLRRTSVSPRTNSGAEIDLRGEMADDAIILLDKFIDSSVLSGLEQITVIHGKGTGALRAAVGRFLKGDKRVKASRPGAYGEGDSGVTVVLLKN
ncbi:MAG: endonuclease MutS2 [Clostridia bacterium]|nr:endonuclease MutS2 [Clostridia bacterium]